MISNQFTTYNLIFDSLQLSDSDIAADSSSLESNKPDPITTLHSTTQAVAARIVLTPNSPLNLSSSLQILDYNSPYYDDLFEIQSEINKLIKLNLSQTLEIDNYFGNTYISELLAQGIITYFNQTRLNLDIAKKCVRFTLDQARKSFTNTRKCSDSGECMSSESKELLSMYSLIQNFDAINALRKNYLNIAPYHIELLPKTRLEAILDNLNLLCPLLDKATDQQKIIFLECLMDDSDILSQEGRTLDKPDFLNQIIEVYSNCYLTLSKDERALTLFTRALEIYLCK